MVKNRKCPNNIDEDNRYDYLIEYRGDFLGQMADIDYACGYKITDKLGMVSVNGYRIKELVSSVPSIIFINYRSIFVLEDSSPDELSGISAIKVNPYLNLTGDGVLIGIADTGIDYMNPEFIFENDESKVEAIWDQTIEGGELSDDLAVTRGSLYSYEDINNAIKASRQGRDPYEVVPSRDENGHGTKIASIVGARGYDEEVKGVANGSTFVIVKVKQDGRAKFELRENGLDDTDIYNIADLVSGIEFLRRYSAKVNKPMVILISMGSTEHSHDASDLFSRYLNDIGSLANGLVLVSGTGNGGLSEGHAKGIVENVGDTVTKELSIPREIKWLSFRVWIRRPNSMSIAIVAPSGQTSGFIKSQLYETENTKYIYENTDLQITEQLVDTVTGLQTMSINFRNIKPGIWKIQLRGEYIVGGRFDIWLPPRELMPDDTKFLDSDPNQTINSPGSVNKVISVGYYNQNNNTIQGESGRGFPLYPVIKPDIGAPGINIIASGLGGVKTTVTGSSAAAAIVAGACALIVQWGIVNKNDVTIYSTKIQSYLIMGADRMDGRTYPNQSIGYGTLNLTGTFNSISGILNRESSTRHISKDYRDDEIVHMYINIPDDMEVNYFEARI